MLFFAVFKSDFVEVEQCIGGSCNPDKLGVGSLGSFPNWDKIEYTIWVTYNQQGLVIGRVDRPEIVEITNPEGVNINVNYFGVKGEGAFWRFLTLCTLGKLIKLFVKYLKATNIVIG